MNIGLGFSFAFAETGRALLGGIAGRVGAKQTSSAARSQWIKTLSECGERLGGLAVWLRALPNWDAAGGWKCGFA